MQPPNINLKDFANKVPRNIATPFELTSTVLQLRPLIEHNWKFKDIQFLAEYLFME